MNFFGHAVAAAWRSSEPAFALGAMLPDFTSLCGLPPPEPSRGLLAAGVAHHHLTDRLFHGGRFAALAAQASRALLHEGMARGPARGAAHVCVELFLDGTMAGDAGSRRIFAAGLAVAAEPTFAAELGLDAGEPGARWRTLLARLRSGDVPDGYVEPSFVAARVTGHLAWRPRLALDAADRWALAAALPGIQRVVVAEAPVLMAELSARLAAAPGADATAPVTAAAP